MLPPPTTIATSTPRSVIPFTAVAMEAMRWGSVPKGRSPISASPDSFSRSRRKTGSLFSANLEPREATDDHVLAGLLRDVGAQLLDRASLVLGVHVLLVEQDDVLEALLDLAFHDLAADVLRLVGDLLLEDALLGRDELLRHVLLGHLVRAHRSDVLSDLARKLLEVVGARDEVGLAVDLDQHADLPGRVDVGGDDALGSATLGALLGLRGALHAQDLDGLVSVAVCLLEGALGVHHPGAGAIAQGLYVLRCEISHCH